MDEAICEISETVDFWVQLDHDETEWKLLQFLYADAAALLAEKKKLGRMVRRIGDVCREMLLRANASKGNVHMLQRGAILV